MSKTYNASSIKVNQNIDHVRKRPGMYIVDTGNSGVHQIAKELIDNAIDEWLAGHVKKIIITFYNPTTLCVEDDGRGIPVDTLSETNEPALTSLFTILGSGGKFEKGAYEVSSGLHGCGLTVVNALSSSTKVWTVRDKEVWEQEFGYGKIITKLNKSKEILKRGTRVEIILDTLLLTGRFNSTTLKKSIETLSFLCPGLTLIFRNKQDGTEENFCSKKGLEGLLLKKYEDFNVGPIYIKTKNVETALGWKFENDGENWTSFCNLSPTPDGGTHVDGAKLAISKALQPWLKKTGLSSKDLKDGLIGFIHVLESDPTFGGQSKLKLSGQNVKSRVKESLLPLLSNWFQKHSQEIKNLVSRAKQIKEARAEYRKAKSTLNKVSKTKSSLPAKLEQSPKCQPEKRDLFLVEGASAGGSATQARDPRFQEILPLKGKILNAVKMPLRKILDNEEIQNILKSIGGGFGPDFDLKKMRVGRVFLLFDADVDGHHLTSLILVFFIKYMPQLIESGKLFVVDSPLFVGEHGNNRWFGNSQKSVKKHPKAIVTRLKGHGSSTVEDLKNYAFDFEKRKVVQVTLEDAERAISIMGQDVDVRKNLLDLA